MVSPEQCCAYYSMLAAEQRLKAGAIRNLSIKPCSIYLEYIIKYLKYPRLS